ncbi:MAG: hypothetical protein ACO3CS_14780, partial [Alphaproteobacteria bacterium]
SEGYYEGDLATHGGEPDRRFQWWALLGGVGGYFWSAGAAANGAGSDLQGDEPRAPEALGDHDPATSPEAIAARIMRHARANSRIHAP